MVKVSICGDFIKIASQLTIEQFVKAQKYAPELLTIKDEKENEMFRLNYSAGNAVCPTDFGLSYSSIGFDNKLYLQFPNAIQAVHDDPEEEKRIVAEALSITLMRANAVEKAILDNAARLEEMESSIQESISVCGEA